MFAPSRKRADRELRRGQITILSAILFPVVLGTAAFAIDVGYISVTRSRLISAAEAGALAAVEMLPDMDDAESEAKLVSKLNYLNGTAGNVVVSEDVEFGTWDAAGRVFTPTSDPDANAVRVTARLSDSTGNPLSLFLGHLLGKDAADVQASAVTSRQLYRGGSGSVYVTSTKDLSNVVLEFANGSHQKFDDLDVFATTTGTFQGTGDNAGQKVVGVWVKSGSNASNDGPGYGERLINPNDGALVHGANADSGSTPHVTAEFEWSRLVAN